MQNCNNNFYAPGFKGAWKSNWLDMKEKKTRFRPNKARALNKAARRSARNNVKRETVSAVKELF